MRPAEAPWCTGAVLFHRSRDQRTFFDSANEVWGSLTCDETESERQALRAAQLALVPLGAANGDSRARQGECAHPDALVAFIIGAGVREALQPAVEDKACYVFEPGNVAVELDWDNALPGLSFVSALPPVTSTVTYQLPIFVPVRGVFSDGRREDGTHFRTLTATVNLL